MHKLCLHWTLLFLFAAVIAVTRSTASQSARPAGTYEFNDSHFHLTNYIQEGTPIREFLRIMDTTTAQSGYCRVDVRLTNVQQLERGARV